MVKKKLVHGKGMNDADYVIQISEELPKVDGKRKRKLMWICPFYSTWKGMLKRGYSHKFQEMRPTYRGCSVCEDWLTFSNFKTWMIAQDWEGKQLDKDILFPGNREYSPNTCVFIDGRVNIFLTDSGASRGKYLIGASWCRNRQKFVSWCGNGAGGTEYLGSFDTELEAHKAWLSFKLEQAKLLAAEQSDPRVAKALIERYENYITEDQ